MADRYWVGGTAAWDGTAGTKWALTSGGAGGQAVPTSADDVFFNAASGANTVTISTGNTGAKSVNCTGFTGTLTGSASLEVAGNLTYVAGMTLSHTGFTRITATATIITGGKLMDDIIINATGGTVTLGSALTFKASGELTIETGTLTTSASNFSITALSIRALFNASASALTLNASTVTISGDGSTVVFGSSSPNFTFNAGTSTINFTGGTTLDEVILDGDTGLTFATVTFAGSGGRIEILGANTFGSLTFTASAGAGTTRVSFDANQTITTLVANGASTIRRLMFLSDVIGTARTLTVGTYTTKSNIDFQDITAAGASSPWSGTSIGNCLGNTNITFTAAKTVYWNLTGTQNWMSAGWATTSGGTPAEANYPLAQDTAVFDNTGAATTVNIQNNVSIGELSASTRTTAMTLNCSNGIAHFYKNFTNGSGVTLGLSSSGAQFAGRSTQTITSAGKTFTAITAYVGTTSLVLGDALNCTGDIELLTGADFNAATYSVTTNTFLATSANTVALGSASWTVTGTGTCWSVGATTTISDTAEITLSNNTATARTFAGGGKTYGKLTIGGNTSTSTTTITGTNTFSEIASTKTVAHTVVFPNVTTTVGAFTVQGSVGNVVTLSRTGGSGTFTLTKTGGGVVSSNYLSISNSTATPIDTWYAGANSTNGGNNTNWIFANAPTPPSSGNFFMFF
jgi:hypothetical protein